ncbi:hypothetical protein [Dolichospermum planctonicum]|nr:hypothetical protein [Dolichospermum planctonicum]
MQLGQLLNNFALVEKWLSQKHSKTHKSRQYLDGISDNLSWRRFA